MKRKIYYILALLIIFAGFFGPHIYKSSENRDPTPVVAGPVADSPLVISPESYPTDNPDATSRASSITAPERSIKDTGTAVQGLPDISERQVSAGPKSSADNHSITVFVAVVGKNKEVIFGPAGFKLAEKKAGGSTVMDALEATGLPYDVSSRWPDLVEVIAGQRNKGQAGWMYKVNETVVMSAANKKQIASGDKIIWWYSESIDNPPPEWSGLEKNI